MIKKLTSLSHKALLVILVLLVAVGAVVYFRGNNSDKLTDQPEYPKYVSFAGNYVFSVPKNHAVDEQSVPGAQLIYSGTIEAKTLEDVYNSSGIAAQAIDSLTDHSGGAFKDYVNKTFVDDLKKNISVSDVKIKFGKANGADNARITATKDGKVVRFVYLKGGQHPAQVVAKSETSSVKRIAETIVDVEAGGFNSEVEPIKQTIQTVAQLVKDKKTSELYNAAAPALRQNTSQEDLNRALQTASSFSEGNIVVSGGSYAPDEFTAAMRFTKLNAKPDDQPAIGSMFLRKVDGQWKVELLSLPTPGTNQ